MITNEYKIYKNKLRKEKIKHKYYCKKNVKNAKNHTGPNFFLFFFYF